MHIPMLDFQCEPSAPFLDLVCFAIAELGEADGAVLNSGKSFHYYGFRPMDPTGWATFLGKALLLAPLVDARQIAHRTREGQGVLRISRSAAKPHVPDLVQVLGRPPWSGGA